MNVRFIQLIAALIISVVLATTAWAAPITNAIPGAFRDNEGASTVGTGSGDNFSIFIHNVLPDGTSGTTASATHLATGATFDPLVNPIGANRPGLFGMDIPFSQALANNWLSPWEITVTNGPDTATRSTADRTGVQKMEFVKNLSITGSGTAPTVTWQLPTTGAPVDQVRYELWNDDTNEILTGQTSVPIGTNAVSISPNPTGLTPGANYAIRIIPAQLGTQGIVSRSSNWLTWQATEAQAEGTVLSLTTGSPAGASQTVDTPADAFKVEFDYRFTTDTGHMDVFLNGIAIGTRLEASDSLGDEFLHAVFEVEDPTLLSLTDVDLLFLLDGLTGSNILVDNISMPGLLNGDFEAGFAQWNAEGPGTVSTQPVPEPATLLLLTAGVMALCAKGRKNIRK